MQGDGSLCDGLAGLRRCFKKLDIDLHCGSVQTARVERFSVNCIDDEGQGVSFAHALPVEVACCMDGLGDRPVRFVQQRGASLQDGSSKVLELIFPESCSAAVRLVISAPDCLSVVSEPFVIVEAAPDADDGVSRSNRLPKRREKDIERLPQRHLRFSLEPPLSAELGGNDVLTIRLSEDTRASLIGRSLWEARLCICWLAGMHGVPTCPVSDGRVPPSYPLLRIQQCISH